MPARSVGDQGEKIGAKVWSMREVLVAYCPLERAGPGLVWKCGFQIGDFFVRFPIANGAPFPCTDRPCQSAVQ